MKQTDSQLRCVLIYLTKAILGLVNRDLTGADVLKNLEFTDPASPSEGKASASEETSCLTSQRHTEPSALSCLQRLAVVNGVPQY